MSSPWKGMCIYMTWCVWENSNFINYSGIKGNDFIQRKGLRSGALVQHTSLFMHVTPREDLLHSTSKARQGNRDFDEFHLNTWEVLQDLRVGRWPRAQIHQTNPTVLPFAVVGRQWVHNHKHIIWFLQWPNDGTL